MRKIENSIDFRQNIVINLKKILDDDTSNEAVKEFINTAYCQQGMGLMIQKDYDEALAVFNKADPGHDCIEKGISDVKASMNKEAEEHYLKGVKYFLNEDLNNAIKEWEKTLALNPEHQKAKINIKTFRYPSHFFEKSISLTRIKPIKIDTPPTIKARL